MDALDTDDVDALDDDEEVEPRVVDDGVTVSPSCWGAPRALATTEANRIARSFMVMCWPELGLCKKAAEG